MMLMLMMTMSSHNDKENSEGHTATCRLGLVGRFGLHAPLFGRRGLGGACGAFVKH